MKTMKNLMCLFIFITLLASCSSGSDDNEMEVEVEVEDTGIVTYNGTVQAIIAGNCISCHGSPTTNGAPSSYTSYTLVKNDINDILSRINNASSPMPTSGLMAQSLRDQIQEWADDGLLEN